MLPAASPPADVLAAWFDAPGATTPLTAGHINETYLLQQPQQRFIVQRLSRIFSPTVNEDIAALTPHIARAGLTTPHLLRTKSGELWVHDAEGGVWRCMTFIAGETLLAAPSPATAYAAGHYLARFHRALQPVQHEFIAQRLGVHDTDAHVAGLTQALAAHRQHPVHAEVAILADEALQLLASQQRMLVRPPRIVHGDPKLSNFLFETPERAVALIDLDTLGEMELALELGDALRSWSTTGGNQKAPQLSRPHFAAACEGYASASGGAIDAQDAALVAPATLRISLELTARFLRDTLEERYFAWDRQRFAHAYEQHLPRARAQLSYARSLHDALGWAEDAALAAFGHGARGRLVGGGH